MKSALKQTPATPTSNKQKPASTPAKSDAKPTENSGKPATKADTNNKSSTPAADKPLNKTQLYINSIKESVSVSDLKALYPKAKSVKMQKRKVGPNHKVVQYVTDRLFSYDGRNSIHLFCRFAFVSFENESDCATALTAHSQIGGEKVNISYAFAQTGKKQEQKENNNNKQEQKENKSNDKKEPNKNQKEKSKDGNKKQEQTNTNETNKTQAKPPAGDKKQKEPAGK